MDNAMKGLFGGGEEGSAKRASAEDFIKRVQEGAPDEGFTTDEARSQLNEVLKYSNADQVRSATKQAVSKLPADQQKAFGDFVGQLQGRQPSGGGSSNMSVDDISDIFGQAGGSANSLDDLLGGLLGGGGSSGGSSGGGLGGMLGGMLGGLGGGDNRSTSGATSGGESGGIGDILGSSIGKAVIGGLAAILTKNLLDGK